MSNISNLPSHLQEKMEEVYTKMDKMLWPQDSPASMRLRERQRVANEMYSLILQELGPVVEALEFYSKKSNFDFNDEGYEEIPDGPSVCLGFGETAQQALKHLKERILNDSNN